MSQNYFRFKNALGKLLKVCFSGGPIYQEVLPYNLNWLHNFDWLSSFFEESPIVVVDIGARGASLEELEPFRPYIRYIAFEADPTEAQRLSDVGNRSFKSFEVHPFFIGKEDGAQTFYLYRNPGESSQLLPDPQYQRSFAPGLVVDKSVSVQGITLNTFFGRAGIDVDVLKLDTQGTEYDVLQQGDRVTCQALLIECEVEFTQMYQEQKLFHHIADLLSKKNFSLLYLNRVFMSRERFKGVSRGQMIFGDALFGLNVEGVSKLPLNKKKKYCALLINYGLADYAYEIFVGDENLQKISPELARHFDMLCSRNPVFRRVQRFFWTRIEKMIALLLYLRKTNQYISDSDRSWPIR